MSILPTYRWGYGSTRLTIGQMKAQPTFALLDDEFQRRIIRMMRDARRAGHDVGVGGAARSVIQQETLFKARHNEVAAAGCCTYQGKHWQLKAGQAHAAPPGKSYHEPSTPAGRALAVDLVGWEDGWVEANVARFGLRTFTYVNAEKWHIQPTEIATSRSAYVGPHPLPRWRFR